MTCLTYLFRESGKHLSPKSATSKLYSQDRMDDVISLDDGSVANMGELRRESKNSSELFEDLSLKFTSPFPSESHRSQPIGDDRQYSGYV